MEARQDDGREDEATPVVETAPRLPLIAVIARFLARAWVVGLILFGAAFAGVAITQLLQQQATLEELRQRPGSDAYAIVAYRRELERQINALQDNRRGETVPQPPSRPVLMEEIDLARARNESLAQDARQPSSGGGGISAPP